MVAGVAGIAIAFDPHRRPPDAAGSHCACAARRRPRRALRARAARRRNRPSSPPALRERNRRASASMPSCDRRPAARRAAALDDARRRSCAEARRRRRARARAGESAHQSNPSSRPVGVGRVLRSRDLPRLAAVERDPIERAAARRHRPRWNTSSRPLAAQLGAFVGRAAGQHLLAAAVGPDDSDPAPAGRAR